MDQDIFTQFLSAIKGSLDYRTEHSKRIEYQTFLNQLKINIDSLQILECFFSSPWDFVNSEHLNFNIFALSFLHEWIKHWWDKLTQADHEKIKNLVFNLIIILSQKSLNNPSYCNKLSSLIADIAERQFPQNWTSFVPDFLSLWKIDNQNVQDIVLKTLTYIFIDCNDNDLNTNISSLRRQEITAGIIFSKNDLLCYTFEYISLRLELFTKKGVDQEVNLRLTLETFSLLTNMIGLVPTIDFILQERNFLLPLYQFLKFSSVNIQSSEIIYKILGSKIPDKVLLNFLVELISQKKDIEIPKSREDFLLFSKNYLLSMVDFLVNNIDDLLELGGMNPTVSLHIFTILREIIEGVNNPSKRIAGEVLLGFIKVFKAQEIQQIPNISELLYFSLDVYFNKALKPKNVLHEYVNKTFKNNEEYLFFEIEFEDIEDWKGFYATLISQFQNFIILYSERYFEILLHFLAEKLQQAINSQNSQRDQPELNENMHLLNFVFLSSFKISRINLSANHINKMMEILSLLYNWQPSNISFLVYKIKMIKTSSLCFSLFRNVPYISNEQKLSILTFIISFFFENIKAPFNNESSNEQVINNSADGISYIIEKCQHELFEFNLVQTMMFEIDMILKQQSSVHVQCLMRESLIQLVDHPAVGIQQKKEIFLITINPIYQELLNKQTNFMSDNFSFFITEMILPNVSKISASNTADPKLLTETPLIINMKTFKDDINILYSILSKLSIKVSRDIFVEPKEIFINQQPIFPLIVDIFSQIYQIHINLISLVFPEVFKYIFNLFQNQTNEKAYQLLYGPITNDFTKYVTKNKITPNIMVLDIFKEEKRTVLNSIYKWFHKLCEHQYFYLLYFYYENHRNMIDNLFVQIKYLENLEFYYFTKYFLDGYFVYAYSNLDIFSVPNGHPLQKNLNIHIKQFLKNMHFRLSFLWSFPFSEDSLYENEFDKFYFPKIYHDCSFLNGNFNDDYISVREGISIDVSHAAADILASILCIKGAFSIPTGQPTSETLLSDTKNQEIETKLKKKISLQMMILNSDNELTSFVFKLLLLLLQIPDSTVKRQSLAICSEIVNRIIYLKVIKISDILLITIGQDIFQSVLFTLLKSEPSSIGLEWDMTELLLNIYLLFCFNGSDVTITPFSSFFSNYYNSKVFIPTTFHQLPVNQYLATGVVNQTNIEKLHKDISEKKSVKKIRDIMKDFLSSMIKIINDPEKLNQMGSTMLKKELRVKDLDNKLTKKSETNNNKHKQIQHYENADLGDFFDL